MAVAGEGLSFHPIYWVYHDQWRWFVPNGEGAPPTIYNHYGHTHLFMLGFSPSNTSGDAFSGSMRYQFSLQDIWGPNSGDPNQQFQYRVVGTPKWYFRVQETWRRAYIQPWDLSQPGATTGQQGLRFDACDDAKRQGPFREGFGYAPLYLQWGRTLPIDYFQSSDRLQSERDNDLYDLAESMLRQRAEDLAKQEGETRSADEIFATLFNPATYNLQHDELIPDTHPAAVPTFSDALYIWPLLEYQTVTQIDWQRLPGYEAAHDISDEQFGDGWDITVEVPFKDPTTKRYNSPFSPTPGDVRPPGEYFGVDTTGNPLVADARKLRYAGVSYTEDHPYTPPFDQPPELSGQLLQWHNPYGALADGRWVQQCLGGIIEARAEVTIEHKLGGRQTVTVNSTQYLPGTAFAGTDQGQPVA